MLLLGWKGKKTKDEAGTSGGEDYNFMECKGDGVSSP